MKTETSSAGSDQTGPKCLNARRASHAFHIKLSHGEKKHTHLKNLEVKSIPCRRHLGQFIPNRNKTSVSGRFSWVSLQTDGEAGPAGAARLPASRRLPQPWALRSVPECRHVPRASTSSTPSHRQRHPFAIAVTEAPLGV